jgi:hypothetical protein
MQLDSGACIGYVLPDTPGENPQKGRDKGWEHDPDPRLIMDERFNYGRSLRIGACMAAMARNLEPYDAQGAEAFAAGALKAWDWAQANVPAVEQDRAPRWQGDLLLAAVEMWRLTGEESYHAVVRDLQAGMDRRGGGLSRRDPFAMVWSAAPQAWISYMLDPRADAAVRGAFAESFLGRVETMFEQSERAPYGVEPRPQSRLLCPPRIGSLAWVLLAAWRLTGEERCRELGEEYVHYSLGRNPYRLCDVSNVAEETYSQPFNMYEWTPGRTAWMPGFAIYMDVDEGRNLSRFQARRLRMTRWHWYMGEPAIGFNDGLTAAVMLLMEGRRYDDLIDQGAFPGVKPFRPGLPFGPTPAGGPWGTEPVVPEPAP